MRPLRTSLPAVLVLLAGAAACTDWTPVERPGTRSDCVPGATGPRAYDALSYAFSARVDWDAQVLVATEDVSLALCPGVTSPIVLDAGTTVSRVHAGGVDLPFTLDGEARTLAVDVGASPGATVTFTVEYVATASTALAFTTSTGDDPVRSRVVFTDSEPRDAHRWLVCKDDPSDRARFSSVVEVPAGEDVISNGERLLDTTAGGRRRVGHALDVPIPTYLMAFAAGELEHADREASGGLPWDPRPPAVPISLWYRRGLPIDPSGNLDAVADAMATFERLLGPYPFERYSVVLLPAPFGGGMENATITFNAESSGTGWVSFSLNAHELAHQWMGDWVTMETYDDVWVKEGMATLLAAEAQRATRDRQGRGRLFGTDFAFRVEDAIVDPLLTGIQKYTSGPYQRAASLITQLRAILGEEAFWEGCRSFLATYGPGSATGEEFLRSFALDEVTLQHALARLPARDVPETSIAQTAAGWTVTVSDPGGALLVPYEPSTIDRNGNASTYVAEPGVPLELTVDSGGYVAQDERDVHPFPPFDETFSAALWPSPFGGGSSDAFLTRSAGHQERALRGAFPDLDATGLARFVARLDSDLARSTALLDACFVHGGVGEPAWDEALARALDAPPILRFNGNLQYCGPVVGRAFEAEFLSLERSRRTRDLTRLEYLLSFEYGPTGQAAIDRLALDAPTRELRQIAMTRASGPVLGRRLERAPLRVGGADARTADDEAKATRRLGR